MADEVLKRDENHKVVGGAVTNDAAQEIRMVRVDPTTGALLTTTSIADTDVVVLNATGAAAINTTTAVAAEFKLLKITCHLSAAPTTSENFILTLDSAAGVVYDTTLYSLNPSLSAATDIVFLPDGDMKFKTGDELVATFANTDACTYGLSIYYQII